MELVGKLSPKAMGWDRNAIGAATTNADGTKISGKVLLGRIVGVVAGLKQTVNTETGDIQTGLKGNFRGISQKTVFVEKVENGKVVTDDKGNKVLVDTGKAIEVTSGVCYLPGGIQEMLEGALASAKEIDNKATVNFAIDLFALPDSNKAGYTFRADNIVAPTAADPLQMLLEQADANAKAIADANAKTLSAPKDDKSKAPAKEGAKS